MPENESVQTQGRAAMTFANILCAISGKEGGFAAVEQAAALAGPQGRLTFLAVTSFRSGGARRGPAIGPARVSEMLERAEGIAREAGVPYTSEVDPGTPPARVILDWSVRYDLLAIGAPASSWPAKLLVARPLEAERRFGDRIVVASDGLEASHALIDLAARLAPARGSNLTLVHGLGREAPLKRARPGEQERVLQEQVRTLARTRSAGETELMVKPGRAGVVVVSAAAAADASLVVMGSRRLEGLRAMGSVSRRVVHQARCSVLLVPPETLEG